MSWHIRFVPVPMRGSWTVLSIELIAKDRVEMNILQCSNADVAGLLRTPPPDRMLNAMKS